MNEVKYYIGIDPAFRRNGFALAIIDAQTKNISYIQFKGGFIDFYRWLIAEAPPPEKCIICVENSNLTNKTFDMRGTRLVVARKSRDVGKNQATSQYVVDICKERGYRVIDMSPKNKGQKWNSVSLARVLKSEGITQADAKTNQDKRDGAKLALIAYKRPYLAK